MSCRVVRGHHKHPAISCFILRHIVDVILFFASIIYGTRIRFCNVNIFLQYLHISSTDTRDYSLQSPACVSWAPSLVGISSTPAKHCRNCQKRHCMLQRYNRGYRPAFTLQYQRCFLARHLLFAVDTPRRHKRAAVLIRARRRRSGEQGCVVHGSAMVLWG